MAPTGIKLTIAIPTYNRNEILKENIAFLLPQLTKEVNLIIYDNYSDIPVTETLKHEIENHPQLKVSRNTVNVGACANIIRCIEQCTTPWIWLLSDDDAPQNNAINTILKLVAAFPDVTYVNFKSTYTPQRGQDIQISGQNELIGKIENIHNLFLISLGLYKVAAVRPFIRFAYLFSYSLVPQFVLLLLSLKSSGQAILSKEVIISTQGVHKDPRKLWSYLPLALGLPTLYELPVDLTKENYLKIDAFIKSEVITRPFTSLERVLSLYKKEKITVLEYNFSQPYLRISSGISFFWKIEYFICRVILKFEFLIPPFLFLINKARNFSKKPVTQFAADRFTRM